MELMRQLFRQNLLRSRAFTQITLDDDCIVKDNKPDLLNIIHTRGSVIFEDVKVSSQTVWVTGQLRFVVLYRSEDNRLESFTDSINFGEKIFMDEVEERDTVNLSGDLEDLNISAINSRKLAVRALLGIHAVCEVPVEEEIVSGVENDPDIQQKSRTMQLLALTSAKKDILRVHSDIALPQSSPNIGHLLYDYVEVRNRQVICTGEQMQIQGEAYVNVLYSSPEGKMEWYETMVPFSESIEGGMTGTQPICWVHCQTKEYEVEPAEDYDGEMRALSLNLSMDVEMKLWEERNVELLADVYSLETNLVPQKEMVCAKKLLIKNEAKLRISEQMKLAEEQERILQLCSFEGHAEMDHVEPVENGLQVEGILTVDILYATTDDSFPIAHTQEQIPFTQIVDVPGMKGHTEDISYENDFSAKYLDNNAVSGITFTRTISDRIESMITSMNIVTYVLVVSAGLLAFIVLYNLNNINISERQRELATLKVLGFYDGEISMYVFRENIMLTVLGTIFGIFFGIWLHRFVILTAELDIMMFGRQIYTKSYIYSILLTIGFSIIVNIVMHWKMKKIDMIESLKSVE